MKFLKGVDAIDWQKWEKLLDDSKYSSLLRSPVYVDVSNSIIDF